VISYLQVYESLSELISTGDSSDVTAARQDFKLVAEQNDDWYGNALENTRT
jgi:hypothetical protein